MIKLTHVSKSFDGGQTYAVKDLSFQVRKGETLVLLGSSGCGKTTTLKMINRLIEPTQGIVEVDGKDVMGRNPVELRRQIGYVFQGIGLFPHMTVEQNVEIVPRLLGWSSCSKRERMQELLNLVGLPAESFAQILFTGAVIDRSFRTGLNTCAAFNTLTYIDRHSLTICQFVNF